MTGARRMFAPLNLQRRLPGKDHRVSLRSVETHAAKPFQKIIRRPERALIVEHAGQPHLRWRVGLAGGFSVVDLLAAAAGSVPPYQDYSFPGEFNHILVTIQLQLLWRHWPPSFRELRPVELDANS